MPKNMTYYGMRFVPTFVFQDMITTHYSNNESKYLCNQDELYLQMCEENNIEFVSDYWKGFGFSGYNQYLGEMRWPEINETEYLDRIGNYTVEDNVSVDKGVGEHVMLLLLQGPFYFVILILLEMLNRRFNTGVALRGMYGFLMAWPIGMISKGLNSSSLTFPFIVFMILLLDDLYDFVGFIKSGCKGAKNKVSKEIKHTTFFNVF